MNVERAPTPADSGLFATRHGPFTVEGGLELAARARRVQWRSDIDRRRVALGVGVIAAMVVGSFLARWVFTALW